MKQKTVIKVLLISCMMNCFLRGAHADLNAMPTVDIYRTKQLSTISVQNDFGKDIKKLSELFYDKGQMKEFGLLRNKIISQIKQKGDFAYVGLAVVRYNGEHAAHATIDVVDKDDKSRIIKFLPSPTRNVPDPDHLIKNWQDYQNTGFSIFFNTNKAPTFTICPANHCMFGFDDKRLRKYGPIFNKLVPKNKNKLIKILKEDKDPEKRTYAAYLLAHLKDGKELVNILIPSIYDSSSSVRNAVMRVLAETLAKHKIADFPIDKLLQALDFPETTDRNKALCSLLPLVDQPEYAEYMRKHGLNLLISELKLLQPNVHGLAYMILKKISGKNYADRDYKSWQSWADNQYKVI